MDKQLTELSAKLNTTYLFYGVDGKDKQMNQAAQDANAFAAGGGVAAARSVTKANGCYTCPNWDIIDRMKQDPQFDVTKVPEKELCEELRKLAPEKRLGCVMEKAKEREGLQKQINELNAKRTEYICAEQKKNPSKADKAFDEAVRCTLRSQAAAKGIRIPE